MSRYEVTSSARLKRSGENTSARNSSSASRHQCGSSLQQPHGYTECAGDNNHRDYDPACSNACDRGNLVGPDS